MYILCTGLNHQTAPLEIREKVSFSKEGLPGALQSLRALTPEGVILSTCNRTEVYAVSAEPEATAQAIEQFLHQYHGLDDGALSGHLYHYRDEDASRHLFRVAAGLNSMILGESQILGQVRDVLTASATVAPPGVPLSRLFHYALRAGRRARDETDIGRNPLSVSYAGVRLAQRMLGDLGSRKVLLVGAGEAGKLVSRALRNVGVGKLLISNRTLARAEGLARELHGELVPFDRVHQSLEECDIVISSTDAPHTIFTMADVATAMVSREDRPLFFFDLAVPRDVDPSVGSLTDVHLFNMDDLEVIAEENRQEREKAAEAAAAVVEEEVERFSRWWRSLETVPLIKRLRRGAEEIRSEEVEKVLRRMPDLTSEERKDLEKMSRSIVNKLLHKPITSLKEPKAASHLQAIRELYKLDDGEYHDAPASE